MNLDLNAIEARAKAATPGPWGWYDPPGAGYGPQIESEEQHARWGGMACVLVTAEVCSACRERGAPCLSGKQEDKDFIAHAREDIPALIAEVRRLREEKEGLYKLLKHETRAVQSMEDELCALRDRLADIKAKGSDVIREAKEYDCWDKLKCEDIFRALRELATALEGE